MASSLPPKDDDQHAWEADQPRTTPGESASDPQPEEGAEIYTIPGNISGWSPGDIPPPRSDGTLRKSERPKRSPPAPVTNPVSTPVTTPEPVRRRRTGQRFSPAWELFGFNVLVFLSSVCVMTLELTASRLIAKHVGSSLYTWTSVIGVVLAGITLGNYLGGWLADRYSRPRTLAWMFFLSSIACASVLWLDQLVGRMPRPDYFSWPTWVLCVVSMMFLVPAILLGTTSPIVASMALERSTRTGTTVGNVYAWGAFGSIVGTFLAGFYLIDVWGTRAIIGMTAATLAMLAATVAGGRKVFRTAVLLGWLQFLVGLWAIATLTGPSMEAVAASYGATTSWAATEDDQERAVAPWRKFGFSVGDHLQRLGLLLRLRDDDPDSYHDESSYSYIQVRDDHIGSTPIRTLRLDKLEHSYFDPAEPTRLHYEYEEIYAAITHRTAPKGQTQNSVVLPEFPGREELIARLPSTATFDAAASTLTVTSTEPVELRTLRNLASEAKYWDALEQLRSDVSAENWGGFSAVELAPLPAGIQLPEGFHLKLRYDPNLETLAAYEVLTPDEWDQLFNLGTQAPWRRALQQLGQRSATISTLFIGGGGFIFPRWILHEYPQAARVDVAELDPAVYQAVRQEMGLTDAEDQRIHTVIGDARNFIDDRVRWNAQAVARGEAPTQYDFIYGDAFNDFSVPWHLTTQEFTQKVHSLMTPKGVFLANIIEIYPRTEVPGGTTPESLVNLAGVPPEALFLPAEPGREREVRAEYRPLEWVAGSALKYTGVMSDPQLQRLRDIDPKNPNWQQALTELSGQTRERQPLPIPLPAALRPELVYPTTWLACPEPFAGLDVYQADGDQEQFVLGLRGVTTDRLAQQLIALQPDNREWALLIEAGVERSRKVQPGRFLGRYVATMTAVFPYVAVFSTTDSHPSDIRDTFVVACSSSPQDLTHLQGDGGWAMTPFAEFVRPTAEATPELRGQMEVLLELAGGQLLTDDFAPVDNLLRPVFVDQE